MKKEKVKEPQKAKLMTLRIFSYEWNPKKLNRTPWVMIPKDITAAIVEVAT
jgi:hypothetical protein